MEDKMKTKINFYKNRLALNFLAKDAENAREIYDAIDGYTVIGILSNRFDNYQEGMEFIREFQKSLPAVSIGLGARNPKQFQKVALIVAGTNPTHVNQIFTGAGYGTRALKANNNDTVINVLISPTGGTLGKIKISTGELSAKKTDAIINVDTAMAMVLNMRAHTIKFCPMED